MGLPLEDIYDPDQDMAWTCLHDAGGHPEPMSLERFPIGMEPITPLRAKRERGAAD